MSLTAEFAKNKIPAKGAEFLKMPDAPNASYRLFRGLFTDEEIARLGITFQNFFPAIYYSLALGLVFAVEGFTINFIKYGGFDFSANIGTKLLLASLGISFATAISEEIAFRGYIFTRVWNALGNELYANLITSLGWALIHVPVTFFVWKLDLVSALLYLGLTILFGAGSAFVYARTKNIASSIFLHVLWQWPIILFR